MDGIKKANFREIAWQECDKTSLTVKTQGNFREIDMDGIKKHKEWDRTTS